MKDVRKSPTGLTLSASTGKYKVVGVDRFSDEDWEHGTYDDKGKAVEEAKKLTKESLRECSEPSMTTVYYAYDDKGNYLGGGVDETLEEIASKVTEALEDDILKEPNLVLKMKKYTDMKKEVEDFESFRKLSCEIFDNICKKAEEVENLPVEDFIREMNFDSSQRERLRSLSNLELFKCVYHPFYDLDISLKNFVKERYSNIDAKINNGKLVIRLADGELVQPPKDDGFMGYSALLASMEIGSIAKLRGNKNE